MPTENKKVQTEMPTENKKVQTEMPTEFQKKICQRTLRAVRALMANSAEMQAETTKTRRQENDIYFAKEFCTVRVCGPRGSGHTTVANKLVKQFKGDVVVIAPTLNLAKFITGAKYTCSIRDILNQGRNGKDEVKAIIVDMVSMIEPDGIDSIYANFSCFVRTDQPFFFIFLE